MHGAPHRQSIYMRGSAPQAWAKETAAKPRAMDPFKKRKRKAAAAAGDQDLALAIRQVPTTCLIIRLYDFVFVGDDMMCSFWPSSCSAPPTWGVSASGPCLQITQCWQLRQAHGKPGGQVRRQESEEERHEGVKTGSCVCDTVTKAAARIRYLWRHSAVYPNLAGMRACTCSTEI